MQTSNGMQRPVQHIPSPSAVVPIGQRGETMRHATVQLAAVTELRDHDGQSRR